MKTHTLVRGLAMTLVILAALALIVLVPRPTHAQTGGPIGYGSAVFGTISPGAPTITYMFPGSTGDLVTVQVKGLTGGLDPYASLAGPDGVTLMVHDDDRLITGTRDVRFSLILPQTGVYSLVVNGTGGSVGDFLLRLEGRPAAPSAELIYDAEVTINIAPNAGPDQFHFFARDCPTTLTVTNLSPGQPFTFPFVVRVRDERGQPVAYLRGGNALENRVTVPANSGRYDVIWQADDPALSGSISLLVSCGADAPGCTCGEAGAGDGGLCLACPACNVPGRPFDRPDLPVCPDLGLAAAVVDPGLNVVEMTWNPGLGASGFIIEILSIIGGVEAFEGGQLIDSGTVTAATGLFPATWDGVRLILYMLQDGGVVCVDEVTVMFERRRPVCPDLGLTGTVVDEAMNSVALNWTADLGADQFAIDLYPIAGGVETFSGRLPMPGDASGRFFDHFPPHLDGVRFVLWMTRGGLLCNEEITVMFEPPPPGQEQGAPCAVRTDRGDVWVHVGPGRERGVFDLLPPDQDILVIGQATDGLGNVWWEIDRTMIPGGMAATSLWVMASDVADVGDCTQVPPGEVPPVVPDGGDPGDVPPGGWGPCGSCDTCGHPADECVMSPEGACLWDPATCAPGGGPCYTVTAAIDMTNCPFTTGSAMIDTAPNCEGSQYLPGTTIEAHAVAVNPKCTVRYWSGCGVSGGGSSISFVPPGSCTVTAHMW